MKFEKKSHSAREALLAFGRQYPQAWALADELRANALQDMHWPEWCYMPMGAWYAVVSHMLTGDRQLASLDQVGVVSQIAALGAWRMTQGIYRFDPALYPALIDTPISGDVPAAMLYQLPEWCVYVETPDLKWSGRPLRGVWAHLEYDYNTKRHELRMLTDSDAGQAPIVLHIGDWTVEEAVNRATGEARKQAAVAGPAFSEAAHLIGRDGLATALRPVIEPVLSLLLYICSQKDFMRRGQPGQPKNPEPKRTRRDGWRLFASDGPAEWDVGVRIGAALRAAYQREQTGGDAAPTGTHIRPHVRRAHWHGFRSGPRKDTAGLDIPADKRKFDLKWLPPIPVNIDDIDVLPAVIKEVRK